MKSSISTPDLQVNQVNQKAVQNETAAPLLGNTASFVSPPAFFQRAQLEPSFNSLKNRLVYTVRKFMAKEVARYMLERDSQKTWRIDYCTRRQVNGTTTLNYVSKHKTAHFGGLMTCNSVWVCPVCSVKIATRRLQELKSAIPQSGLHPVLVTYTIQHSSADPLSHLLDDLRAGIRSTWNGAPGQRIYRAFSLAGYVKGLEIRDGRAGWHPHIHQMLLSEIVPGQFYAEKLKSRLLARYGGWLKRHGYTVNEHTIDVSFRRTNPERTLEDYLTKISAEISLGHHKVGQSLSPFQMLDAFNQTGDMHYCDRFTEYAHATFGAKQLIWSRGLLKRLGLRDKSDEEIGNEQEEDAFLMAVLNRVEWQRVLRLKLRAELLHVASSGDVDQLFDWLVSVGVIE